jgi:RHS repeat-associated protein
MVSAPGVSFDYDADGRRVKKATGGTGTLYWYGSGGEVLQETDLAGVLKHEYVYFNGKRTARVEPPIAPNPPVVHYYFSDHLGSSNVVTSGTGSIEEESDFYPFGGERAYTDTLPDQSYKFTGKERDPETNLDYFGARYYAYNFGRFVTPDWAAKPTAVPYADFGNPQSLNLYSYVNNNPTTLADADGHVALVDDAVEIGIAITFTVMVAQAYYSLPPEQRNLGGAIRGAAADIKNWFQSDGGKQVPPPTTQTGTQAGTEPKDVYIDPSKYPATAGHVSDAQAAGQPAVVTVDRPGTSNQRGAATAGHATQAGTDRDEYPPAVTKEGGTGASVRNIPASDNRGAGAAMGNQIRNVPNGGTIRIVPKPKPPKPAPKPESTPKKS